METKIIKTKAKEIYTKTKLPGCDWVINQYVGCQHACSYCYAKFISRWRPKDYGVWGSWVEAKMNAPELVQKKNVEGWVYMSSISDPYQPIEKELKLTRKILKNLNKKTKLSIQTKSDLILRDMDLFQEFEKIQIGLTINDFTGKAKKFFEPFSSSNGKRIEVLKSLKKNNMETFSFVSPIIPNLTDIKNVIERTRDFTDFYWFEFLNARGAGKEFMDILKDEFPESYDILKDRKKYSEFIREMKNIITSEKIEIEGIETHFN